MARGFVVLVAILLIAAICLGTLFRLRGDGPSENDTHEPSNGGDVETGEIIIGVEYVVRGLGEGLRDLGIPAVKPLPESFSWDTMQTSPEAELDFTITDDYVEEYQGHGFTHLVLGLRVAKTDLLREAWMVHRDHPGTQAVDPRYHGHYARWVESLVERYDMDGVEDMPGLRFPVLHYEIGVEFSSYQPEPTEAYLRTLEIGYEAAHNASDRVLVGHSAFLLTPVFRDDPGPGEYEEAFAGNLVGAAGKGLEDIHMILDRPELFDVVNVHNLGWPYEIERIVRWVEYETRGRGYSKPIMISDTVPTSFAGFGSATRCEGANLATLLPPATEADRCRLAEYFKRLISGDQDHIEWLRRYLASDVVQRVVIAAEQGIILIDTAFTGDIPGANLPIFQAAAGNSGWSGMVEYKSQLGGGLRVVGKRPAYYALQQLQARIRGYTSIDRVKTENDLRLYKLTLPDGILYVAWYGYQGLYLAEDPIPMETFSLDLGVGSLLIEEMMISPAAGPRKVNTEDGVLELPLTPEPVYLYVGHLAPE